MELLWRDCVELPPGAPGGASSMKQMYREKGYVPCADGREMMGVNVTVERERFVSQEQHGGGTGWWVGGTMMQ